MLAVVGAIHFSAVQVTILTHYYPPEVGAPQARLSRLADGLADMGLEVTVHTTFPHYPDGLIKAPYRNELWRQEVFGAVRVVRTPVYPTPNRGFGRRLASHLSFGVFAVAKARCAGDADVVIVETPPLFAAAAGVAYAKRVGAKLIVHVSDRWPASAIDLGVLRSPYAIRIAERLEEWCYRRSNAIVVPTDGLRRSLGIVPAAAGKVHRIGPSVDRSMFAAAEASEFDRKPLRVLYAGTLGLAQGVHTLIEAAELVGADAVEVEIAGDGAEEPAIRRRLVDSALANVKLLGRVPHDQVPALYAGVDAAVVLLRDRPIFEGALPTKMFEAMAAARPIVLAAAGESADLVRRHGCGVVVEPENPEALADAFRTLAAESVDRLQAMGDAGRRVAALHDVEAAVDAWQALLERVVREEGG